MVILVVIMPPRTSFVVLMIALIHQKRTRNHRVELNLKVLLISLALLGVLMKGEKYKPYNNMKEKKGIQATNETEWWNPPLHPLK